MKNKCEERMGQTHIQAANKPAEVHSENEFIWMWTANVYSTYRKERRCLSPYHSTVLFVFSFSVFHFLNAIGSDLILVLFASFFYSILYAVNAANRIAQAHSPSGKCALVGKRLENRILHENSCVISNALAGLRSIYCTIFEQFFGDFLKKIL